MTSKQTKNLNYLVKLGAAVVDSHVITPDGAHSKISFTKHKLYRYPKAIFYVANDIAEQFKKDNIDAVVGLAYGGITLGVLVAYQLEKISKRKILNFYVEKDRNGLFLLQDKSNQELIKNKKVLLLDDAIDTARSAKKFFSFITELGGKVAGFAVICTRNDDIIRRLKFPKFYSFMNYPAGVNVYPADKCPMCKKKMPINKEFGLNS